MLASLSGSQTQLHPDHDTLSVMGGGSWENALRQEQTESLEGEQTDPLAGHKSGSGLDTRLSLSTSHPHPSELLSH